MGVIFAIDPGNIESGIVFCIYENDEITQVLLHEKITNEKLLDVIEEYRTGRANIEFAIEMVASYGMPVGRDVFQTCVWIGRFTQAIGAGRVKYIYRKEEKMCLCHSMKANDSTIRQALVDRFTPGERNYGKGTKDHPGFFYGFKADVWAAMAVATTYFDKYIRKIDF